MPAPGCGPTSATGRSPTAPRSGTKGATAGSSGRTTRTGTPPFDVRRSDTGRVTPVFPGPDARGQHFPPHGTKALRRGP
ncbi:DUF1918 domain-containing protein [Streptomyces sp. NPDC004284]|uniref:DUF1918 domain-containing protein n=1 Tax=Streptomyces sp. NPDC004284 TaxID=3364695 RepID=UPI0036C3D675